ncbi:hypothetical protein PROVRETT_07078 [Providencia rettgeri DSM 1131]|nr:hypothetical protein PROVRETT_07078 [Providencia rettgeri DSM 1131]
MRRDTDDIDELKQSLNQTKLYFKPSLRTSVKMAIQVFFFYLIQTVSGYLSSYGDK